MAPGTSKPTSIFWHAHTFPLLWRNKTTQYSKIQFEMTFNQSQLKKLTTTLISTDKNRQKFIFINWIWIWTLLYKYKYCLSLLSETHNSNVYWFYVSRMHFHIHFSSSVAKQGYSFSDYGMKDTILKILWVLIRVDIKPNYHWSFIQYVHNCQMPLSFNDSENVAYNFRNGKEKALFKRHIMETRVVAQH